MSPLIQGLGFGFGIAVPVGPIGLLCLRRSLHDGRLAGLVSGLGAATADAIYGIVAALGLTAITDLLLPHQHSLHLVGGLFLLILGGLTLRARSSGEAARARTPTGLASAYFSVLALTLTNPLTILTFIGFFTALGASATSTPSASLLLVLGVFLGSAVWWVILSVSAGVLRTRLQGGGLRFLNIFSGIIIMAFGLWQLIQVLM